MKLRAITLSDVRQFTAPVTVRDIGDGLNVLSAPNESGKSTLFDAIHAMFFTPHTSARFKTLRPDVGGNPDVTLEIDTQGARHLLHKRWGRGKTAEVWREGRLIAKGDAAEAFIQGLTRGGSEGGPAGLLWVRQGLTDLDQGTASEQKSAQEARRDLLSSVTGEFDAMTGGKRMDRALARARADLAALVTQRGPKAGGPFERALKHLAELEARRQSLLEARDAVQDALAERRRVQRELAALTDPDEVALRQARLREASERFEAAQSRAAELSAARARLEAARSIAANARAAHARARRARETLDRLTRELTEAQAAHAAAAAALETARAAHAEARAAEARARGAHRQAEAALRQAQQAAALTEQIRHRDARKAALSQASALARSLPDLQRAAATGPDPAALQAIAEAQEALNLAVALANAAAPKVTFSYDSPATPPASLDGAELPAGTPLPVPAPATIVLPGYGAVHIDPGGAARDPGGGDAPERARARLQALLDRHGLASVEDARRAARARQEAEAALAQARATLTALAPDGVDALRAEVDRLGALTPPEQAPDPDDAQRAAEEAERALRDAEARSEAARQALSAQDSAAQSAAIAAEALAGRIADLRADPALAADPEALNAEAEAAEADLARATAALEALATDAPDLAAARAALERARDVTQRAEQDIQTLRETLAALNARIDLQAGAGIDDDLADVTEQAERARADVAAFETETAVLTTLIEALEAARDQARERYFLPVLTELRPMLRLLWPGAELRFDGDSLLPSELIRDGRPEPIGTLSGGTREQIALLVRLAFSRLLARAGTPAPVILDDALVYTDDERIERMFDALHAQATDVQILVFSCRNRALRHLGGHALKFEPAADQPIAPQ